MSRPKKPVAVKTPAAAKAADATKAADAAKAPQRKPRAKAAQVKPDNELKAQQDVAAKAKKSEKPEQAAPKTNAKPAAQPPARSEPAKAKPKKAKLVRDSFTMPENEYQAIGEIKKACIGTGFSIKKSELLRIGVALLQKMTPEQVQEALADLPALKAGRPKKEKEARPAA